MSRQKDDKLKSLLAKLPHGHLVDTRTLEHLGISRQLAHKYVKSGWLDSVIRGLYRRPHPSKDDIDWRRAVRSLQHMMGYASVVGGRTALEEQGLGHYLMLGGKQIVHLYGDNHPTWLHRLDSEVTYVLHGMCLFAAGTRNYNRVETQEGALVCSSPERALLEMLDELPGEESFHIVDTVFESMTTARPSVLGELLCTCESIKVKRLFFVFADRYRHAWRKYIDVETVDLGTGDRALTKGGKLHPTYRITVPRDLILPKSEEVLSE